MIGIDVVAIPRLREALERQPGLSARLFSPSELDYCHSRADHVRHLAGTLAAKEAVIKTLKLPSLAAAARRVELRRAGDGSPFILIDGEEQPVAVSITHDGPYAAAVAMKLSEGGGSGGQRRSSSAARLNPYLVRYMSPPGYRPASDHLDLAITSTLGSDFP